MHIRSLLATAVVLLSAACSKAPAPPAARTSPAARPSILLVTLDTTRADAVGPSARDVETPSFNTLVRRGRYFRQAYAAVPETLPSHASILSGLYPAGHGIHENGRYLDASHPLLADQLGKAGYRTAAVVSSFVLSRRFGLARGFETYDDEFGASAERDARATTDRALALLARQQSSPPLFLWVHYFDAHAPYQPPAPFDSRYAGNLYLGEVAAVDAQLGRLTQAFEERQGPTAIVVAADHGEGLGEHGESQHGHLLYQSTMHVPLVIVAPGVASGEVEEPVSTRRIFHTILSLAGIDSPLSLTGAAKEIVLGEAMKPFLDYGWQPQTMAVAKGMKAIEAGVVEAYDMRTDPGETRNLGSGANLPAGVRKALDDYPAPSTAAAQAPAPLDAEARQRLASLGYVGATAAPAVRANAPRPADMVQVLATIERASGLFVSERYAEAIPLFEQILTADSGNLDAALRLGTAHSMLRHDAAAIDAFRRAARISPDSPDVRTYLGLHYERSGRTADAAPLLERAIADAPDRLAAVEGLARVREREGRAAEAVSLYQKISASRPLSAPEYVRLGQLAMSVQQSDVAIDAYEQARRLTGSAFRNDLELGVLYLASRQFEKAREALDRVPPNHPERAMALFKRAQVSVLLREPDSPARIEAARRGANSTTRELIRTERLFQR